MSFEVALLSKRWKAIFLVFLISLKNLYTICVTKQQHCFQSQKETQEFFHALQTVHKTLGPLHSEKWIWINLENGPS